VSSSKRRTARKVVVTTPTMGMAGKNGVVKERLASGLFLRNDMADRFTSTKRRSISTSATAATLPMSKLTAMVMMIKPLMRMAITGVCFSGCSLPKTVGRFPSRPMANETREVEKTMELTAATEPIIIPTDIRAPPTKGMARSAAMFRA